ncbi:site-specific tyrosine recombinase XerC [Allorhodopirellula solitaria]|uniref:Tyrosine recombinase XerD n=1 Tax=Allorhodopirellula solitaria TaxID=2527987 RepID=A0A5C5WZK2_9BACT|nr:site-specific tyrosine recombinase XerC [Allorhodopirellula solitaria]TWT55521.1 Tyrosine recombinase XerD [Allorhodopirellula solitaria]
MPRKGDKQPPKQVGNLGDPQGMAVMLEKFLEWMRVKNYSERTVENRHLYLNYFIQWAEDRGLTRPTEITKPILERYQRFLYHYRKADGQSLSFRSQSSRLVPVRAWFKWLTRNNHILYNPASELELPRLERRLPKHVLTIRESETVLAVPNVTDPLGLRDRAILETLYSTGIRRMEVVNLKLYDMDVDRGTLMVRQGKGKKDRMVPIGKRAIDWINKYITEVRPRLIVDPNDVTLFLTHLGEAFTTNRLTQLVREYIDAADIGKRGSCHLFRHTMATLMLENGADIRFIQAMLGHAKLETTQIYTQVSIRKLKEIHEATHPAKMNREEIDALPDDPPKPTDPSGNPSTPENPSSSTDETKSDDDDNDAPGGVPAVPR